MKQGFKEALIAIGGGESSVDEAGMAGLHQTETVDLIAVLSDEIHAVLDKAAVRLCLGGSFIQCSTRHSWSSRGSTPCTLVAVMVSATR